LKDVLGKASKSWPFPFFLSVSYYRLEMMGEAPAGACFSSSITL